MYKLGAKRKFGRNASHRRSIINNMLMSFLNSGKVITTTPKAKVLKANVDSYIQNISKFDSENLSREIDNMVIDEAFKVQMLKYLSDKPIVKIVKFGFRKGDNSELSKVYFYGFKYDKKKTSAKSKKSDATKEVSKSDKSMPEDVEKTQKDNVVKKAKNFTTVIKERVMGKERARTRAGI